MYKLQNFKAEMFKALAHPIRIKILEVLRESEKNVTELQNVLGLDQSTVSQQLSLLRNKNLIATRKVGSSVFYSVSDPLLFDILDTARAIFNNHIMNSVDMLEQGESEFQSHEKS